MYWRSQFPSWWVRALTQGADQQHPWDVRVGNGYLEFYDEKSYEIIKNDLKGRNREFLDLWENNFIGFESARSIFEKAIDMDERLAEENSCSANTVVDQNREVSWYNFIVDRGSAGNLVSDLWQDVYRSSWQNVTCSTYANIYSGSMAFHGRDQTTCSM